MESRENKLFNIITKQVFLQCKTEEEVGSAGEQPTSNMFYGSMPLMREKGYGVTHALFNVLMVSSLMAKKNPTFEQLKEIIWKLTQNLACELTNCLWH